MKIKRIRKSFIAYALALSVMLSNSALAAMDLVYDGQVHNYTTEAISLMVNQISVETAMPPVIIDNRTLVPARAVFEQLGASVLWVPETKQLFVTMNTDIVILQIDDSIANVNGEIKIMEVAPKIISKVNEEGSTMIPIRFVAEALNFKVGWDGEKKIISVDSVDETVYPPIDQPSPEVIIPVQDPIETQPSPEVILPVTDTTFDNYGLVDITNTVNNNIGYEKASSPQMVLKKDVNHYIDINSIVHEDKYLEGYYRLTLPGDYSSTYGYGTYKIDDTYLNTINIKNNNGKTELVFNQKNIYAYRIQEDSENIYITILNPKEVYKHVVVIDPGHGGSKPGNANNVYNGVLEKTLNLEVGNRLYALLQADPDIKVYTTRTTDVHVENLARAVMANHVADLFVSIHGNSLPNATVSGVQVFYPKPNDQRGAISQKFSKILMSNVTTLSGIPERGADQTLGYDLTVLLHTTVPACLVETGFMTNLHDATKLSDPNCQQAIAQGLYEAIKEAFDTIIPTR